MYMRTWHLNKVGFDIFDGSVYVVHGENHFDVTPGDEVRPAVEKSPDVHVHRTMDLVGVERIVGVVIDLHKDRIDAGCKVVQVFSWKISRVSY